MTYVVLWSLAVAFAWDGNYELAAFVAVIAIWVTIPVVMLWVRARREVRR